MKPTQNTKTRANEEKKRELQKDTASTRKQCQPRLTKIPRRQHPLHHQLVGAMRGHRQKHSPQTPRPKRVALRQVEREVEQVKLARGRGDLMDLRPSSRNVRPQRIDRHKGSAN